MVKTKYIRNNYDNLEYNEKVGKLNKCLCCKKKNKNGTDKLYLNKDFKQHIKGRTHLINLKKWMKNKNNFDDLAEIVKKYDEKFIINYLSIYKNKLIYNKVMEELLKLAGNKK